MQALGSACPSSKAGSVTCSPPPSPSQIVQPLRVSAPAAAVLGVAVLFVILFHSDSLWIQKETFQTSSFISQQM